MELTAEQLKDAARKAYADGNVATARSLIARAKAVEANQPTTMLEQIGNGLNEGIAATLGAPLDLMTMGLNAGITGVNRLVGTDVPTINNPVGGSGTFQQGLAATGALTDALPETTAQRYGRSIARETGAMAVPGGIALRSAQKPVQTLTGLAASAASAGTGAQAASDLTGGKIPPQKALVRWLAASRLLCWRVSLDRVFHRKRICAALKLRRIALWINRRHV